GAGRRGLSARAGGGEPAWRPPARSARLGAAGPTSATSAAAAPAGADVLQVTEEVGVRAQHQGRVLADAAGVVLEGGEVGVKLGVCPEGLAVDARRLGVGLAADLLRPPLAVGEDAPLLALGLAVDLGAAPGAFGAELLGDALALGDHPILDLAADLVD